MKRIDDKKRILITLFFLLLLPTPLFADQYTVRNFDDAGFESLRSNIDRSCDRVGDDEIRFEADLFGSRIVLNDALEIPRDCDGRIVIVADGFSDVIIDGSRLFDVQASLIIASDDNTIWGLSFVGAQDSAGLSVQGDSNRIRDNRFGLTRWGTVDPNHTGLFVIGDSNVITDNISTANSQYGMRIDGDYNDISGNWIGDSPSCDDLSYSDQDEFPIFIHEEASFAPLGFGAFYYPADYSYWGDWGNYWDYGDYGTGAYWSWINPCGNGDAGLVVNGQHNSIGRLVSSPNRIRFNGGAGLHFWSRSGQNRYVNNIFSENGDEAVVIEPDSWQVLAEPTNLSAKPISTEPANGIYEYEISGINAPDQRIYVHQVATNDMSDMREGARLIEHFRTDAEEFAEIISSEHLVAGSTIVLYACSDEHDCSEFSEPLVLQRDSDNDGLSDEIEDSNQDESVSWGETNEFMMDTDRDDLPDGVEDRNGNGIVDPGETDPRKQDTDGDGLNDFIETGGDGSYDPDLGDTDPQNPDTDADLIFDGTEDRNKNGVIELGETDPRRWNMRDWGALGGLVP